MPGNSEVFQKAMNQGHTAAWDQSWDKAAGYYRMALSEFPDHPLALTSLALALYQMQDYDMALAHYQRASQVAPDDAVPLEKSASIYERQGKTNDAIEAYMQAAEVQLKGRDADKAVEDWMKVITLQPDHLMARTRLAMVYERMGKKEEAAVEYLATASIMQRSGDMARAMQVVEYTMQMVPHSHDAQQYLIMLRNNQPLPKPLRPRGSAPLTRKVEVHQLAAPPPKSAAVVDPIQEALQTAMVQLAAVLFDQDEENNTGKVSRRGIGALTRGTGGLTSELVDRAKIALHLGQAIDSQSQGNLPQAAEELERAEDIGLRHQSAYFDLGYLHSERDGVRALRYLQKSVKHPDFALGSYLLMGQIYMNAGNFSDAAVAYLQAMKLADSQTVPPQGHVSDDKSQKELCINIANQLIRADWHQYLQMARQQLPAQPPGSPPLPLAEMLSESGSSQVVETLAQVRLLASRKMHRSAMEEAYHALQHAPTYLPLHIQIGELLLEDSRIQDAVEKFLLVSELYSLRGEAAQAIRLLTRVTNVAPMDLMVRSRLIELLSSQGRIEEAIQQYMELADIYYHLAELDMARQTYTSALKLVQQSKVNRTWSIKILTQIADIDMQRLDLRQALRIFEQIRTLAPEDPIARTQLVLLNYRMGQDGPALSEADSYVALLENSGSRARAIEFINGLVTERPEKLELRKRLADLYVRDGKVTQAVEQLDVIADSLMAAGNRAGAMTMLQAIIAFNPPNVMEYRAALAKIRGSGTVNPVSGELSK
jgi:tetratricopeptide (TPR) repeat protein